MINEKILIINTGGTIGMVHMDESNHKSPLRPAKNWEEIIAKQPALSNMNLGVEIDYFQFSPLLDSSNLRYENWVMMAKLIEEKYESYSGFVVLHGTDTMSYTAAALSFMFENLSKPVVITGSQVPIVKPRTDAVQNLITSIIIAAGQSFGCPLIPEVCIFFRDKLYRGNRTRKISSIGYSGFDSPNYPPLATAGVKIKFNREYILNPPSSGQDFFVNSSMDTSVMVLEVFPGFDPEILRVIGDSNIKGLILKTYGAGNAPLLPDFLNAIQYLAKKDIIVVNVTQCPEGMVELGMYETSAGLLKRDVISGVDLTPNAAVTKLMYLLGQDWPPAEVKRQMLINLKGEQSLNIYHLPLEVDNNEGRVFMAKNHLPANIDLGSLKSATLFIRDIEYIGKEKECIELIALANSLKVDPDNTQNLKRCAGRVKWNIEESDRYDLFLDITKAVKKWVKSGMFVTFTMIASGNIKLNKKTFDLYIHNDA